MVATGQRGYRVHAAVWQVETAGSHESNYVGSLLDAAEDRGFAAETSALDTGYDNERV